MQPFLVTPGADLVVVEARVPDALQPMELTHGQLPADWRGYPAPRALQDLGSDWAQLRVSLLLRVPSAVTPNEHNVLVNPLHPDAAHLDVRPPVPFAFDPRLRGR